MNHSCKICGETSPKLARCHIYPHSLTRDMRGPSGSVIALSLVHNDDVSFANGGTYDETIVCLKCEKLFAVADQYAIEFRRLVLKQLSLRGEQLEGIPEFEGDPELLHTFAMTTWLRTFLCERNEYKDAADPRIANEVKTLILAGKSTLLSGRQVTYGFSSNPLSEIFAPPVLHEVGGFSLYHLQMPNMAIWISADSNGLPNGFRDISLRNGSKVSVWVSKTFVPVNIDHVAPKFAASADRIDRMLKPKRTSTDPK